MQLSRLIADLPIVAPGDARSIEVLGLRHDSRRVVPGDLFVGWSGEAFDGGAFAEQAAERGAVAVLCDRSASGEVQIPWLVADEPRRLLAPLAARLYGHPDRDLKTVGITGTNGKTTVMTLVAAILRLSGKPTLSIGTLGYFLDQQRVGEGRTTPEASELFMLLRSAVDRGAGAAVMEVSSHALVQGRVDEMSYDVTAFLNLTRDHLDFHQDLEDYFSAKRRLFELRKDAGIAVVGVGDEYGRRAAADLEGVLTFGTQGDVRFLELALTTTGIRGAVASPKGTLQLSSPLLGDYNAENLLAAIAIALALEIELPVIESALNQQPVVEGRMDRVDAGQDYLVVVDYAHTPGALEAALIAMRSLVSGELIVVFGCGGNKDQGKRELMGRIAGELADHSVLTSDNPRSEAPQEILRQVEGGLRTVSGASYEVVEDRRAAIDRAIGRATAGDGVLIAGKGHEREQIVGNRKLPFVDRDVALQVIEEHRGRAQNQ